MKSISNLLKTTVPYTTAALYVAAALLFTHLLWRWIEPHPTSLFLAAITISAWYGGFRPSLLATALAAVMVDYFFVAPVHSLELSVDNVVRGCVFVLVAVLISWIDSARKQAIKERDRMLARERAARKLAETANQAKDEFLAMVSHELRTPLNVIVGWVAMLRSGKLKGETASDGLERIERNARLQQRLIQDLIDVSRIAAGRMHVKARPMEVRPVIEDALRVIELTARAKGLTIHTAYPHGAIHICGDSDRLQQVVWNLLLNAIRFTPHGGSISVVLASVGHEAILSVRDSGCGIRPEFLPYVFEGFRQDEKLRPENHGGLGLGLTIVRHIVELHGGSVEVESAGKDQGATFKVRVPLAKKEIHATFPSVTTGSLHLKKTKATNLVVPANVNG